MTELLAGDIGGTKTILRWMADRQVLDEREYASQSYGDLVPIVQAFFEVATLKTGDRPGPRRLALRLQALWSTMPPT